MRQVFAENHPRVGHYSNAVLGGGLLFVSGQAPLDPATGKVVQGDFRAQVRQCLRNVEAIVAEAGCTRDDIVRTTVYLHDWADYAALNEVYAEVFPTRPPARSTVQGSRPPGQRLAIEAIAAPPR